MTLDYSLARVRAVSALAEARRALDTEIAGYPTPISGCDAQFNHLLAERRRLAEAARALDAHVFIPTPRSPAPLSGVESR